MTKTFEFMSWSKGASVVRKFDVSEEHRKILYVFVIADKFSHWWFSFLFIVEPFVAADQWKVGRVMKNSFMILAKVLVKEDETRWKRNFI